MEARVNTAGPLTHGLPTIPEDLSPRTVSWSTALDNHEPTRRFAYGSATEYDGPHDTGRCYRIEYGLTNLRAEFADSLYLLDDGATVRPFYVAGYHEGGPSPTFPKGHRPYLLLHPFPTNPDGKVRPDNGRVIDFSSWMLGPRRAYHLKVRKGEE